MSTAAFFPRFRACFDDERLPPQARLLLLALLRRADNDTLIATPSLALLAKLTGLPRSTIYEQRAVLIRYGYVSIRERSAGPRGQIASEYTLRFPTGSPQDEPAEVSTGQTPAPLLTNAGTHDHVAALEGRSVQTHLPLGSTYTPPLSVHQTPPVLGPDTALSVHQTPPVLGPDTPLSGHQTHSAPGPTAPSNLRESERARWNSFISEYEAVRRGVYGDAGSHPTVTQAQRADILLGVSHVVERTAVDENRAARTIVEVWIKEFEGTDGILRKRAHPLRYLAGDIGDVTVLAVKALSPTVRRAARPRDDTHHAPRMAQPDYAAMAAAALKSLT